MKRHLSAFSVLHEEAVLLLKICCISWLTGNYGRIDHAQVHYFLPPLLYTFLPFFFPAFLSACPPACFFFILSFLPFFFALHPNFFFQVSSYFYFLFSFLNLSFLFLLHLLFFICYLFSFSHIILSFISYFLFWFISYIFLYCHLLFMYFYLNFFFHFFFFTSILPSLMSVFPILHGLRINSFLEKKIQSIKKNL